jgi:hypothetical protein
MPSPAAHVLLMDLPAVLLQTLACAAVDVEVKAAKGEDSNAIRESDSGTQSVLAAVNGQDHDRGRRQAGRQDDGAGIAVLFAAD